MISIPVCFFFGFRLLGKEGYTRLRSYCPADDAEQVYSWVADIVLSTLVLEQLYH